LRATCGQLAEQWAVVIGQSMPEQAKKSSLMHRWRSNPQIN
jgi:hypothetical protein